jgi:uncharacterized membrane protein YfcA
VEALELVLFCAWCFVVAVAGGAVGLVLGNIRLPVVLLVASSPAAGAGANIGISGVAAFAAAAAHIRAGRINWRLFAWMAPPSMAGAVVGGLVSGAISETALLIVIGVISSNIGGTSTLIGGAFCEVPGPESRIAKPIAAMWGMAICGTRIAGDYARSSGIRAERATFCPRRHRSGYGNPYGRRVPSIASPGAAAHSYTTGYLHGM